MNRYDEMYRRVLERRDAQLAKKKSRITMAKRVVPLAACFCFVVLYGYDIWKAKEKLPKIPVSTETTTVSTEKVSQTEDEKTAEQPDASESAVSDSAGIEPAFTEQHTIPEAADSGWTFPAVTEAVQGSALETIRVQTDPREPVSTGRRTEAVTTGTPHEGSTANQTEKPTIPIEAPTTPPYEKPTETSVERYTECPSECPTEQYGATDLPFSTETTKPEKPPILPNPESYESYSALSQRLLKAQTIEAAKQNKIQYLMDFIDARRADRFLWVPYCDGTFFSCNSIRIFQEELDPRYEPATSLLFDGSESDVTIAYLNPNQNQMEYFAEYNYYAELDERLQLQLADKTVTAYVRRPPYSNQVFVFFQDGNLWCTFCIQNEAYQSGFFQKVRIEKMTLQYAEGD